jgi:hypothetical protein
MSDQPTTKPTLTALIRRIVCREQEKVTTETIRAELAAGGYENVKASTISTIRADALATLREAAALGLLVTTKAVEETPKPSSKRSPKADAEVTPEVGFGDYTPSA